MEKNESRRFSIRGESYNEIFLNRFYREEFYLCPLSKRKSEIEKPRLAYIENKIFLHRNETYFVCKVYLDIAKTKFDYYLLKPKLIGKRFTIKKSPIVAVLRMQRIGDMENKELKMADFQFIEWAYPKANATI